LQARTGLLTPPGIILIARSYNACDLAKFIIQILSIFRKQVDNSTQIEQVLVTVEKYQIDR
jgi:hypothetical protein